MFETTVDTLRQDETAIEKTLEDWSIQRKRRKDKLSVI